VVHGGARACGLRGVRCLKLKFECQLDRARSADLIQRIEATALAATSEGACEHRRRLTEVIGRIAEKVDWVSEVRMVEDIEKIHSCLKGKSFCKSELPPHRQIDLRSAKSPQSITPEVPLLLVRRDTEGIGIDDFSSRRGRIVNIERHSGHHIWSSASTVMVSDAEPTVSSKLISRASWT
jgi:hypothetical protein